MIDFKEVSEELFPIMKTYSNDLIMYDESGMRVYDPKEMVRVYAQDLKVLVSVNDNGENSSIKIHVTDKNQVVRLDNLIKTLRACANSFNLMFTVKVLGDVVTPDKLANTISESVKMNIFEGMYGTLTSSYIKLPSAKVIIRHSSPVKEGVIGARGRSIKAIFVENASGERFQFPVNNLLGARAFAKHISSGGSFADNISSQIIRMTTDYQNLKKGISSIENCPSAIMPDGSHLSVSIHEAIKTLRGKLHNMDHSSIIEESSEVDGKESVLAMLSEITNNQLSEEIMTSIVNNIGESKKDPYGTEYNKDRDVVHPEGEDAGEGMSESIKGCLKESMDAFDSWLYADQDEAEEAALEPTPEATVEAPVADPVGSPMAAAVEEDPSLALIAAINMAQEALRDVMERSAPKFATMPAHQVVEKHIIPEISKTINDRKIAYDGLVNAVNLALNGGGTDTLMAMLDVAATASGYSDFADFTFSASIGDVLGPVEQAEQDPAEPEVVVEPEVVGDVTTPAEQEQEQVVLDAPITDDVISSVEQDVGIPQTEKIVYEDYLSWLASARKIDSTSNSKFSFWNDDVLVAKWEVVKETGWVQEEKASDGEVVEEFDLAKQQFLADIGAKQVANANGRTLTLIDFTK